MNKFKTLQIPWSFVTNLVYEIEKLNTRLVMLGALLSKHTKILQNQNINLRSSFH